MGWGQSTGTVGSDAALVTTTAVASLSGERRLAAGTGLALVDGGADSTITIDLVSGAETPQVRAVSAPYTVASDDYALEVSGTGALTLPAASVARALKIRSLDGTVTVTRNGTPGTDTVEGGASFALGAGSAAEFITRGAGAWRLF